MKQRQFRIMIALIWIAGFVFLSGCAGRYYLMVDYELPLASKTLDGIKVQIWVEDQRQAKKIMRIAAQRQFKSFKDRYSLAWIMPNTERVIDGEYDLKLLFKMALAKRLSLMGATVVNERNSQAPTLEITVDSFFVNYKSRKWIASIDYQGKLTTEGHPVTRERVRGEAERVKIIGRKGADVAVSQLFTDAVNRLDVEKMFRGAKLIP